MHTHGERVVSLLAVSCACELCFIGITKLELARESDSSCEQLGVVLQVVVTACTAHLFMSRNSIIIALSARQVKTALSQVNCAGELYSCMSCDVLPGFHNCGISCWP